MRISYMSYRIIFILALFTIGFAILGASVALAQGTYSCKWVGRPGVCVPVDNCAPDSEPGDVCEGRNSLNCNDTPAQKCVGVKKKAGETKSNTYSCEWDFPSNCHSTNVSCGDEYKAGDCSQFNNDQGRCNAEKNKTCITKATGPTGDDRDKAGGPTSDDRDKAGGPTGPGGEFQIKNPLQYDTIPDILNAIAGFLYALALAVVTIMVLIGAFQILTATGNPTQIDAGKRTLLWAVIGTVVILVAGGIADLTADILGGKTRSSPGSEIAGTAGCSWVKLEVGPGRCAPDLNCKSGYTAPNTLNCRADTQVECGAIPVKNCVEK